MAYDTLRDDVGNHRTAVNDVISSLADSIVSHAITLVVLLPVMKLAYEENSYVAVFWHDEGVFNFVWRGGTLETSANPKQTFFVEEWIQLVKVTGQLNSVVSFPCVLAVFESVVVTVKLTQDLYFRFEVMMLK